jgi:DNA-binding CsgD family transcriptional regulator
MRSACTLASPLSQKQKTIWSLISKGLTATAIAEKLHTTRQFVNQTKLAAEARLSTTLLDVAQANDLQVTKLYPKEGILLGYHPALKRRAILTYSTNFGIKVWYWHDNPEEVTNEEFLKQTRAYLLDIAKERGIEVEVAANLHPAKLAHIIFGRLLPEIGLASDSGNRGATVK